MVAELDDEILAIAGIVYHKNLIEIFSDMKEKMREYPVSIWKGAKAVMEFVSGYNLPVHAIANSCYPEAEEFLSRLGFVFVEETEQGRLYKWNTSQKS